MSGARTNHSDAALPRIHAALVHFPISAWTGAAVLEFSRPWRDSAEWMGIDVAAASIALLWVGLGFAAIAAVAGFVELSRLPEDEQLASAGNRHMVVMSAATVCFLLLGLSHPATSALAIPQYLRHALCVVGVLLLFAGGHLGSSLVVRQRPAQRTTP